MGWSDGIKGLLGIKKWSFKILRREIEKGLKSTGGKGIAITAYVEAIKEAVKEASISWEQARELLSLIPDSAFHGYRVQTRDTVLHELYSESAHSKIVDEMKLMFANYVTALMGRQIYGEKASPQAYTAVQAFANLPIKSADVNSFIEDVLRVAHKKEINEKIAGCYLGIFLSALLNLDSLKGVMLDIEIHPTEKQIEDRRFGYIGYSLNNPDVTLTLQGFGDSLIDAGKRLHAGKIIFEYRKDEEMVVGVVGEDMSGGVIIVNGAYPKYPGHYMKGGTLEVNFDFSNNKNTGMTEEKFIEQIQVHAPLKKGVVIVLNGKVIWDR